MSGDALTILITAVEPSADSIGASVMREISAIAPSSRFIGCGGPLMAQAGVTSLFPIDKFSVMGVTDAFAVARLAMRRARELAETAAAEKADVAVLIDSWAFSKLVAKNLRELSPATTVVKLVAPQVWASRPERVKLVKRYFDGVLAVLPFEPPHFAKAGVKVEFVGNPNFQAAWRARGDSEAFRARHNIGDGPLLAVLLGSRRREVAYLAGPFRQAVEILQSRTPGLKIVTPVAESVDALVRRKMAKWPGALIIVGPNEKYDAMAAADVALTASGTASTELAINRTPMVVAYKVDPITALWARSVVKTPFASIINVAAGRFVIPELIQEACEPAMIAGAVERLLKDPSAYVEQASAFATILKELGVDGPPAALLAAKRILEWSRDGARRVSAARLPASGPVS